jgi:hypothetical protein
MLHTNTITVVYICTREHQLFKRIKINTIHNYTYVKYLQYYKINKNNIKIVLTN